MEQLWNERNDNNRKNSKSYYLWSVYYIQAPYLHYFNSPYPQFQKLGVLFLFDRLGN